jgi:hypothetical protein
VPPLPSSEASAQAVADLLWESCRRRPDSAAVAAAARRCDPSLLLESAVDHRIAPLVWRALDHSGCGDAVGGPGTVLRDLADVHRVEASVVLPRAVRLALRPLTEAGLEPVVMKGPAVASRYPAPGLRPMEDIDVLLPRRAHRAGLRALTAAGWTVVRPSARDRYDTVLRHTGVPLALELHHGLASWYERATALDAEALWRARTPLDCLGTPAFGLPVEHELVMLAAHAGKPHHSFRRLVWTADLAMVAGDEGGGVVDWDAVRALARRARCSTVVAAALALGRRVGVDAPAATFPLPDRGWRAEALAGLLDPRRPLAPGGSPTFHLRFALTDTGWRRGWLLAGMVHEQASWAARATWPARATGQAGHRWWALRHGAPASLPGSVPVPPSGRPTEVSAPARGPDGSAPGREREVTVPERGPEGSTPERALGDVPPVMEVTGHR